MPCLSRLIYDFKKASEILNKEKSKVNTFGKYYNGHRFEELFVVQNIISRAIKVNIKRSKDSTRIYLQEILHF